MSRAGDTWSGFSAQISRLSALARDEKVRTGAVLVASPILIMAFTYFGSNDFYRSFLSTPATYHDLHGYLYHHLGAFVLLGLGSVVIAAALGLRPREIGLSLGDRRLAARRTILVIPLLVLPITFLGSYSPDVAAEYPLAREALAGPGPFALHAAFYVLYYVGWEVHFRGFLLFGVEKQLGMWPAILIQTIPSTLIHTSLGAAGKPFAETFGALPAGIALGWITLRTRSILPALVIHAAIGLLTDLWQYLHVAGAL